MLHARRNTAHRLILNSRLLNNLELIRNVLRTEELQANNIAVTTTSATTALPTAATETTATASITATTNTTSATSDTTAAAAAAAKRATQRLASSQI
jgi:hypothetical protein